MKPGRLAPHGNGFSSGTVYPPDGGDPVYGTIVVGEDGVVRFEPYPQPEPEEDE